MTVTPPMMKLLPLSLAVVALSACASRGLPVDGYVASGSTAADGLVRPPSTIGGGAYHYRYTLRDSKGQAMPHAAFALSLTEGQLPFVPEAKKVWQDTTDAHGQTPVFALGIMLKPAQVFLRPRLGSGPFGEQMQLVGPIGDPLPGTDYQMVICTDPPIGRTGTSDAHGNVAYAASPKPVDVRLSLLFRELAVDDEAAVPSLSKGDEVAQWRAICKGA